MQMRLRRGMTTQEVLSAFGEPANQIGRRGEDCVFRYIAPFGLMTADREGYIGFEVQMDRDRVIGWRTFRGTPSYEPAHMPRELKWIGKFYLTLFVALFFVGAASRRLWGIVVADSLLKSFNRRAIDLEGVPAEFRFITHDLNLQAVIDRVGKPTRMRPMSVKPWQVRNSKLVEGDAGEPAIVVAEYDLPNAAAVILVPEFPFEPENQIRTVYYRKPPRDWEPVA